MAQETVKKSKYNPAKPTAGLFDRIILAIQQEKEFKKTKKILAAFIFLLLVSVGAMPFSGMLFIHQWQSSGAAYFIAAASSNLGLFFNYWQDFLLSIFESLPFIPMALLLINITLLLFTLRLFLYKKGMLLRYIKYNFSYANRRG